MKKEKKKNMRRTEESNEQVIQRLNLSRHENLIHDD